MSVIAENSSLPQESKDHHKLYANRFSGLAVIKDKQTYFRNYNISRNFIILNKKHLLQAETRHET